MSPTSPDHDAALPPPLDHTPDGRFAPGNRAAANPFARRTAAARRAFAATANPRRLKALALKLFDLALEGNVAAAKIYLGYAVGKPGNAADPDRLDQDEVEVLAVGPKMLGQLQGTAQALLPGDVVDVARAALPAASAARAALVAEALASGELPEELLEEADAEDDGEGMSDEEAGLDGDRMLAKMDAAGEEADRMLAEGHAMAPMGRSASPVGMLGHTPRGSAGSDRSRQGASSGDGGATVERCFSEAARPRAGRPGAAPGGGGGRPRA